MPEQIRFVFEHGGSAEVAVYDQTSLHRQALINSLPFQSIARGAKHDEEVFMRSAIGYIQPEGDRNRTAFTQELLYGLERQGLCLIYGNDVELGKYAYYTAIGKITSGIKDLAKVRARLLSDPRLFEITSIELE